MNTDPMMTNAPASPAAGPSLFAPPVAPSLVAAVEVNAPGVVPAPTTCPVCPLKIFWVRNRLTGKVGPCDPQTAIYVVDLAMIGKDVDGSPAFEGWTKNHFLEQAAYVVMKDGRQIPAALLDFGVIHFATCSSPDALRSAMTERLRFSVRAGRGRKGRGK